MQIAAAMQNLRDEHNAALRGMKDALATELKTFMTEMAYKVSQAVAPGSAPPELLGVPMGPSRPPPPAATVGTNRPPPPAAAVGPSRPSPPAAAVGPSRPSPPGAAVGPNQPPPPAAAMVSSQPDMTSVLKFPSNASVALAQGFTLYKVVAADFFVECMRERSGNPPSNFTNRQAKPKAIMCLDWFKSMATEEEKQMFVPGAVVGVQRQMALNISCLIQDRLAEYYSEVGPVPDQLRKTNKGEDFLVSACASRRAELKDKGVTVAPDMFLQWRQEREARRQREAQEKREAEGKREAQKKCEARERREAQETSAKRQRRFN
ncbi:hypothetical protein CYMTET_47637 [Cymbomonas tetramitiformis]|uniref:Uncharacterized protein n=1 Tax=Cymbomonas tetramitiformis TaxID=36881 RepID=A0AAE0EWI6_9CHLO|nr:hypothetical protein CYMTET_47637 [Cymbomonas tetramitiformis]